jgi:hypothetical protein
MGTGSPRLHRQLASAVAVLAIWLALAPHARADLLPAVPLAPVAASTIAPVVTAAAEVSTNAAHAAGAPAATAGLASTPTKAVWRAVTASPALHAAVSPVVRRLAPAVSPVVKPVFVVVDGVSSRVTAIATAAGQTLLVRPLALAQARQTAIPLVLAPLPRSSSGFTPALERPQIRPHGIAGPRAARAAPRWLIVLLGTNSGSTGAAASPSGGASGPPAALRAVPGLFMPFVLRRFAAPPHAPHSYALLLSLERPD